MTLRHDASAPARLRGAFDAQPRAQLVLDAEGQVVQANRAAQRLLGAEEPALTGRPWERLVRPSAREQGWPDGLVSGAAIAVRVAIGPRRGDAMHAFLYDVVDGAAPQDQNGHLALVELHDPPEPAQGPKEDGRRAEPLQAAAMALLDEIEAIARVGSWAWDSERDTVHWSDELRRIHGLEPGNGALTLEDVMALVLPEDRSKVRQAIRHALMAPLHESERACDIAYRIRRPDGQVRMVWGAGRVVASAPGRVQRMHGVVRDITEEHGAERAVAERTAELERSNRDLEQFASIASHDLQEPLRVVRGYLQVLEQRSADALDERSRLCVERAVEGTERMGRLIDDLLRYARVGTRGRPPEPVPAEDALRAALDNLGLALRASGARVTHGPLPVVLADRAQLTQLFQNLVSNAVKFCADDPPRVHVSARPSPRSEQPTGSWTFEVRDHGIGIPPGEHARMFEIFQRLHGEDYPGTGIGLAVCKRIVERLGGRIWAEETPPPGGGARFRFTLPGVDA